MARGFLLGGTAGRTTLNGEGLQHQDGHSHIQASLIPSCISYDPTYAYEIAVIIQDGMRRMFQDQENVFYYITVMNEKYPQPMMPKGVEKGILKGMYLLREGGEGRRRVQLFGSGAILREVLAAADMLAQDFDVAADVWSVTSFTELAREGARVERWNMLHPEDEPQLSFVQRQLRKHRGPVIAASDYVRAYSEQIRSSLDGRYVTLGTDGWGRSDSRAKLRHFFEVDRSFVTVAALKALADEGEIERERVAEALSKYGIDPEKPDAL
jgi:pyruvate dehydrogenase E1 component